MIKILYTALLADGGILFFDEDFGNAIFCCDEMGGLSVNVDNINLEVLIMMKMILILLFMSDFWLGIVNLKKVKHVKKVK